MFLKVKYVSLVNLIADREVVTELVADTMCPACLDAELKKLPRADSAATLMPYSYYRLSTRSGYGAGNKAPAYFHLLWDAMNGEGLQSAASTYLVKLAAAHRKAGNIVSSAEVIEAVRLATTLSRMRGSASIWTTISSPKNLPAMPPALWRVPIGTTKACLTTPCPI